MREIRPFIGPIQQNSKVREERMGRKSVKENKTVYQQAREQMNLTREAASELLGYISADRIEKIENEKTIARPEEVVTMSQCYKKPELCNYYCSRECPIALFPSSLVLWDRSLWCQDDLQTHPAYGNHLFLESYL